MDGGRLSAVQKGKQKAADDADLPPAALVQESEGEPRPAGEDAAANWHAGGAGLPRHLLLRPTSGTSEIEEAPPSPPPAPSSRRLPALNPEDAAAAAGLVAVLESRMKELQAALDSRLRLLELLRRGIEGSKGEEASKRRRDGADEPEEAAGAEVQMLHHHHLGPAQEIKLSGMNDDTVLALRLQAEEMQAFGEFWKQVVPPHPQRQRNNISKAELEQMKALEEFWKPVVPVPQRNNSKHKINSKQVLKLVALTSGLVVPYISFWIFRLPINKNLTHIVGAISVLWILRITYSCCQQFRTSRTISRHVPRLIYVCFWLLVLYVLYLVLRLIHGTFAGASPSIASALALFSVCLANISGDSDGSTGSTSS